MQITELPIDRLHAHPANSNVMPPALFDKLVEHLRNNDRYPPIIVRPFGEDWQLLDGHHRYGALKQLHQTTARCVVWDVDDDEALMLLATLNRLQGHDDPRKRGQLINQLAAARSLRELEQCLPERQEQLQKLMEIGERLPTPRPPQPAESTPVPVHFFLLPAEKAQLETRLAEIGPTRETALMKLVTA